MELDKLTGTVIAAQTQTLRKGERVWKYCKTYRIVCIVAGVNSYDSENTWSTGSSQAKIGLSPCKSETTPSVDVQV